ncbi:MAG: hypothetical protein M3O24_02805 [Thermoproteota archaeon]|nr:hypothetical protein [Thermoproteota archaeon]
MEALEKDLFVVAFTYLYAKKTAMLKFGSEKYKNMREDVTPNITSPKTVTADAMPKRTFNCDFETGNISDDDTSYKNNTISTQMLNLD